MKMLTATGIEALVCEDIERRQAHGITKYGTTVSANPLTHRQWLQHAYEEALDLAVYLRRAMEDLDPAESPSPHVPFVLKVRGPGVAP